MEGYVVSADPNRKDLKDSNEIDMLLAIKGIANERYELNLMLFHLAHVEKLILEDFKIYNQMPDNVPSFRILYAGKIFIEDGGYTQKSKDKKYQRVYLNVTTLITVIGTGLAGLYGLFEIAKWGFHFFHIGVNK